VLACPLSDALDAGADADAQRSNMFYQLQRIFGALQESELRYFDASGFCAAYRDYDNLPLQHNVQMDASEFFNVFFDRLETALKGSPQQALLDRLFGGKVVNQLICYECPHRSERAEKFFILSLEVKDKSSLYESLKLYVQGEMLDGQNKYFCQVCS
jgi:ubiquitin carboxyl-terminal hydrolase 34